MREGSLPLILIHRTPPSFLDAALEARRAMAGATTDASLNDAASRMVVQLHGLADCIGEMASTGLLNVDVTALNLQTNTRCIDGQWTSQTRVVRLPPPFCSDIKLPPDVCNTVMQALVVFSAVENDSTGELAEMREMAAMVEADWPDLSKTGVGQAFEVSMRAAWMDATPGSPHDTASRFSRALSEKLRGAAQAAGGGDTAGTETALEYARRTLAVIASAATAGPDR